MALAEEQRRQAAASQAKALANEADKRCQQNVLAMEQCCQELAKRAAATAEKALAMEQRRQELAKHAAATAEKALAMEQRHQELAEHAAARAENMLAVEQCRQELAKCVAATAEKALAAEQCHQELAERAAETVEKTLAAKHCCRELAKHAAALADSVLVPEQPHQESAERAAALAVTALAEEQRLSSLAEVVLAEYDAQTIASWDAAAVETAKHATMLAITALTKLKAAPKVRYGGPPPTHFSLLLTAKEVAELDAATLDKQHCHKIAVREKTLAGEGNKQRRAAMQEKALANKVNKRRHQVTATQENALANDAFEQRYQESAKSTDLALPPMAVSPPPHRPTTYKDTVLSSMGGSSQETSLILAPAALPLPAVDSQLWTVRRRARPHHCVGQRHGPRAPNPQVHILHGRRHWPCAPNKSTSNG